MESIRHHQSVGAALAGRLGLVLVLLLNPLSNLSAATLGDAVRSALDLTLQEQRTEATRALADATRKRAALLTAEPVAARLKGVSDAFTGDQGAYELEANLDLPLWLPGQRGARRALADALSTGAESLSRRLRWEMAGRVRETAWAAVLADVQREQAAAALNAARALESTVTRRESAGEAARMDRLIASQETRTLELELADALLGFDHAISAYVQLTGQSKLPDPLLEKVPTGDDLALPPDHPLVLDAQSALAEARAERDRVGADGRGTPLLSVGAKRVREAYGTGTDHALQLELSIPIASGRYNAPALAAAERDYTDRSATLMDLRRQAELDLRDALIARRGAAERLVLAERRAALAADALALRRRAFELGELDLAELLRAEERAREARLALALCRAEKGRAAARLNQALGVIPE